MIKKTIQQIENQNLKDFEILKQVVNRKNAYILAKKDGKFFTIEKYQDAENEEITQQEQNGKINAPKLLSMNDLDFINALSLHHINPNYTKN